MHTDIPPQHSPQHGFLVISPTLDCNNSCIFCYDNYHKKGSGVSKDVQEISEKALCIANEKNIRKIAISGGEPLLYKHLRDLVQRLKKNGIFVCIMTNGRLLKDSDLVHDLLESGVDHFHIPVHSDLETIHDAVTGMRGSFQDTIAGLENIRRERRSLPLGLTIVHVVHTRNFQRIPEFTRFISTYEPDHVLLSNCIVETESPEEQRELIVKFEDMMPLVAEAHTWCHTAGMPLFVENIPPCAMRGNESICMDFFKFNRVNVGGFKAADRHAKDPFTMFEQSIKSRQRTHASVCRDCAIRPYCGGFYISYAQAHGEPEVAPYSAQELRQRLAARQAATAMA